MKWNAGSMNFKFYGFGQITFLNCSFLIFDAHFTTIKTMKVLGKLHYILKMYVLK